MSTKTPFEIRTEVLAMAKDYMDKQFALNQEFVKKSMEAGYSTFEDLPKFYSTEDLMQKAKEFYSFVSKKD